MHNQHILDYYYVMWLIAKRNNKHFAQLHYYTLWHKENDPEWGPYKH